MSAAGRSRRPEFSQHFLRSRALATRLVELIELAPSDFVMEVGPGLGALTEPLTARIAGGTGRLVAVELDPELARAMHGRFADAPQVGVREGDFLRTPIPPGARVVANLPFAITSDAVRHITASEARDAHLMVQREAAERFAGSPYGGETLPALLLKPWWHIEILRPL